MERAGPDDSKRPAISGFTLTRRQLLAGAATATATGGLGLIAGSRSVRFRRLSGHRVQFELNGEPAWVIDTRHFGGRAALTVVEEEGRLRLELTDARHPGTSLPAGMVLELDAQPGALDQAAAGTLSGALMSLRLELGGFEAAGVPFAAWLAGEEAARSRMHLPGVQVCAPESGCSLTLSGTAAAEFRPDWTITLHRRSLAHLTYRENLVPADDVTISRGPGPSSRVTLHREARRWPAILPSVATRFGQLSAGRQLYERAYLELWDPGRAPQTARLTFAGDGQSSPLSFHPAGKLLGKDGHALAFPLQAPRYTITLGQRHEASLTAQLSRERVWAMAGETVLVMGATAETPPFAWTEREGTEATLQFRPTFVTLASAGMSGLLVNVSASGTSSEVSLTGDGEGLSISLTNLEVVRPADMLHLSFTFRNMSLQAGGSGTPVLVPTGAGTPEMEVTFPPQHIAEQAVYDGTPAREDPAPPVTSRLAGASRLTFEVLAGEVPFSLADLLTWDDDTGRFQLIAGDGSQLEIPYRLFMSVPASTKWIHSATPVEDGKRTELWHTRVDGALSVQYTTPDSKNDQAEFLTSLTPRDRWQIADRTQNRDEAEVSRLMLSALGGWLMARGSWEVTNADTENSLAFWSHHIAMGRDVKVVVVEDGYLAPFGHRASQITISERKFQKRRAYLRQKTFLVVRQPVVTYDKDDLPFATVELKSLTTPPLDEGSFSSVPCWAVVGGVSYPFHVSATDKAGEPAEFLLPMAWVSVAEQGQVDDEFYNVAASRLRTAKLQGQRVAYAPTAAVSTADDTQDVTTESNDTILDTVQMRLKVVTGQASAGADPDKDALFRAQMERARVRVPAVEQFSETGGPVDIRYHQIYLEEQFGDANPWEVFAELIAPDDGSAQNRDMKVPAAQSSGLVAPSYQMRTLTRGQGPSGINPTKSGSSGISTASSSSWDNSFRAGEFFSSFAKLFGVIDFASILQDLESVSKSVLEEVKNRGKTIGPYLLVEYINEKKFGSKQEDRKLRITLYLDVSTAVSPSGGGLQNAGPFRVHSTFDPNLNTAIRLMFIIEKDLGGKEADGSKRKSAKKLSYGVGIEALWFDLVIGDITLEFERLAIEAGKGVKKFTLKLGNLFQLAEALSAVAMLTQFLPKSIGAGDPDETANLSSGIVYGIEVGLSNLPPLGSFEIRSIRPWFWVILPTIDGVPLSFRAGISLRYDPFVMVMYLGAGYGVIGGGYFSIWFTPKRVTHVEVQLEAGGFTGFSAGPIKGEVTVRIGLYLHLALGVGYDVTGFLRITGQVSIKVVDISIEIYLAMSYYSQGDYWEGVAKFSVTVTIGIIEIKYSTKVTKQFTNGNSASAQLLAGSTEAPRRFTGSRSTSRRRRSTAYCQAFCNSYA